jgi:hypothetical protein
MSAPLDIAGILERAGADANAPEGSQAWALGQAGEAIAELIEKAATAEQVIRNLVTAGAHPNWGHYADDLRTARTRVGGA